MFRSLMVLASVAVLAFSTLVVGGDAFAKERQTVAIKGKFSKIKLDGICSANGGSSYQSQSGGGYGCTKGKNTVECDQKGNCTGYIGMISSPGSTAPDGHGTVEGVLQTPPEPAGQGSKGTTGVTGGATGGTATFSQ